MKAHYLQNFIISIVGFAALTACDKTKSAESPANTEQKENVVSDKSLSLIGNWKYKGNSIVKMINPQTDAKELIPGIFEHDPGVSYNFESSGKFSRKSFVESMGGAGTWKFMAPKLTLTYTEDGDKEFTVKFTDDSHMILTAASGLVKEYYERQ